MTTSQGQAKRFPNISQTGNVKDPEPQNGRCVLGETASRGERKYWELAKWATKAAIHKAKLRKQTAKIVTKAVIRPR